jgi:transposase
MLTLAHNTRIYVYVPAADLRKSFDGLTGLVRSAFQADPRDGSWFLFFNKRRDRLKILAWEADGFAIWYKQLAAGSFESLRGTDAADTLQLDATELTLLLSGVSLATAQRRKRFAASA